MKFFVKQISPTYREMEVQSDIEVGGRFTVTSGLLDPHKARELAEELRLAADTLQPPEKCGACGIRTSVLVGGVCEKCAESRDNEQQLLGAQQ